MIHTKILGTGSYVPEHIVSNFDLEKLVDTNDEWIQSRTGIVNRRVTQGENTSELAYKAAVKALEDANTKAEDIDLIIVATVTADYPFPAVAQILQRRLNCKVITAFDINAACTGFIYALNVADKMIRSGAYHKALVIGAETLTKYTDYEDRNTCVLFADAAGAMVIGESETSHIEKVITYSKGDLEGLLKMEGYPLKENFKTPEQKRPFITMQGTEVFKFATSVLPQVVKTLIQETHHEMNDVSLIIAHQANRRIIDKSARVLKIPMEKMFMNIDQYGNTSAASVPLAIDEAIRKNVLKRGDLFITAAFGAGLTWGGAMIKY